MTDHHNGSERFLPGTTPRFLEPPAAQDSRSAEIGFGHGDS